MQLEEYNGDIILMEYDVVIAGAGPAGFGAAMGAAKLGKKVLIFDRNSAPGGVAAYCGCPVFAGLNSFVPENSSGAAGLFAQSLEKCSMIWDNYKINTSEFSVGLMMSRLLRDAGVDMLFYVELTDVKKEGNKICSVTVTGCGKHIEIKGKNFVDCTGDAVLSYMAGAEVQTGSAEETMTKTLLFRVTGVENYNRAACVKAFEEGNFPFTHQDRFMGTPVGEKGEDFLLNLTAVSGCAQDPAEMTRMDLELREQIPVVLEWAKKTLPGFANCHLVAVAPVIGVRGGRNMVGIEHITAKDLEENTPVTEPVAIGKRTYGEHYIKTFIAPWAFWKGGGPRAVPYGALRSVNIANLAAGGRGIGIEPKAVSAIRLMPVCIATGQAAGIAAAMDFPSYPALRQELINQKCKFETGETK